MRRFLLFIFLLGRGLFASSVPVEIDMQEGIAKIDQIDYPMVAFGTARMTGRSCTAAVLEAVKGGYTIIDTATSYGNFDAVAKALRRRDRKEFYLISKVWHNQQSPEDLYKDLNAALEQLKTNYLDAYLIHWPNSQIPIEETLAAMENLRQNQKIRHIGLSNVSVNHVKRALETGVPITWVQVEMNPFFYDAELLKFCQENAIVVQAWAPLGTGAIAEDPMLAGMGKKYGKTPAQVAIKWIIQHGCIPIPKSANPKHIHENNQVFDFALTDLEMEEIDNRAKAGERTRFSKEGMGFADEYDFSYEECWPKGVNRCAVSPKK